MSKRITALVTAALALLLLTVSAFAAVNPGGDHGLLVDERDVFTQDEENKINDLLLATANELDMNVAVYMPDTLGSDEQKACMDLINEHFGRDSSSIVLMFPREGSGRSDWIAYTNRAAEAFHTQLDTMWDAVYYGLNSGESVNYTTAIVQFCAYMLKNRDGYVGGVNDAGNVTYKVRLADQQGELSEEEFNFLYALMQETAEDIGANIGVVLSNHVGSGNEERFTDNFLDESFGAESSSIVLMMVMAGSGEQDWISCTQSAYDAYGGITDRIFDAVYRGLDSGSGDNYPLAIEYFCTYLRGGSIPGLSANNSLNGYLDYDSERYYDDYDDDDSWSVVNFGSIVGLFTAALISLVSVNSIAAGYKKRKPISARAYVDNTMTRFTQRSDVFVREFTTSHRISSSSSGGGSHHSGGGGGHSRSGSRGGGGGRHR